MKIQRSAEYAYSKNGITEDNGYTKWYNWNTVKRHTRYINGVLTVAIVFFAFLFRNSLAKYDTVKLLCTVFAATLIWLFAITPLHEILHLLPLCKCKFDDKCIVTIGKGTVSAIYNGHITRVQYIISLILPFIAFGILLTAFAILTSGLLQLLFIFLLVLSCYGSYTDVYMVFYSIKHINKTDIIFGLYKKRYQESE